MRRAVRRSTSANGNSVRICVASYTTVAPDAEPDGRQPAFGMVTSFHPLLNLHPVSRCPCYQKLNIDSADYGAAPPARRAFSDSDLIIYDHSRQSVANPTFLQDRPLPLPAILA
ncbi:hypothetical protein BDI4_10047 [Burkholderia diffusa]|nr:hypothetical protein BDI4_10047 [Burkholderia diffusa]